MNDTLNSNKIIVFNFSKVKKDACCPGWTGASCNDPVCTIPCANGRCVAPDKCACNNGYAGEGCQYSESKFIYCKNFHLIISDKW